MVKAKVRELIKTGLPGEVGTFVETIGGELPDVPAAAKTLGAGLVEEAPQVLGGVAGGLAAAAPAAAMGGLPGGVSKREYLDYEVRTSLSEGIDFDLIAMCRSEGPGCYCAVNHNLREVIDAIGGSYRYVVIDNEAGMEHLSRRTTRDVQHLLIVSAPTQRGIVAAGRIAGFRRELDVHIENAHLIINRLPAGGMPSALQEAVEKVDAPLLGTIPEAGDITEFDYTGRPLVEIESDSPVYQAVAAMLEKIL